MIRYYLFFAVFVVYLELSTQLVAQRRDLPQLAIG